MRRVLISTKHFIFVLFLVGVTVRSAESLSSAIPLGTSTKRANSKRANYGRSCLFQDAVSSVSSFALRVTKVTRGPSGRRCPPWWSRRAISGSTWQSWRTSTRHAFSTPPSPRQGCSATPSRALPSSSRRYSSRPRRSSTSCPGVMHHPPLPPGPGLSLPVAEGAFLRPPELLRPRPNRHLGWRVEPLAGERRPPRPSQAPRRPGSRRSGPDAGNPEMLEFALSQETARTAPLLPPVEGREENLPFHFVSIPLGYPLSQTKSNFLSTGSQVHGTTVCDALLPHSRPRPILPVAKRVWFGDNIPLANSTWDPGSSVRMHHPPLLPFAAPPQVCRLYRWSRLHSVWRRGSRYPACLTGSRAQFDSATRFSSPGDLPSLTAFSRRRWQSGTPLSCARRLLSSWQRMQSSRSLQPRSWICESWTGLYTSSRSRCWCTGAWSNAFSPRIGLQRSTWRTLTFTFRSFHNTDRF